MTTIGVSG